MAHLRIAGYTRNACFKPASRLGFEPRRSLSDPEEYSSAQDGAVGLARPGRGAEPAGRLNPAPGPRSGPGAPLGAAAGAAGVDPPVRPRSGLAMIAAAIRFEDEASADTERASRRPRRGSIL
jgi:hypothetical protein